MEVLSDRTEPLPDGLTDRGVDNDGTEQEGGASEDPRFDDIRGEGLLELFLFF